MGCKDIELGWKMYTMALYGMSLTVILIVILAYMGIFPDIDTGEERMMMLILIVPLLPAFPLIYLMEIGPVKFCDDRIVMPSPRYPIFKAPVPRHSEIKYTDIERVYQILMGQKVVAFGIEMKNGECEKLRLGPFCSEDTRK